MGPVGAPAWAQTATTTATTAPTTDCPPTTSTTATSVEATTTTAPSFSPGATTTTVAPTTVAPTTVAPTTPDPAGTTTTTAPTAAPTASPAPTASGPSGPLAFTGLQADQQIVFAAGLMAAGGLLVLGARRRKRTGVDSLGCVVFAALVTQVAGDPTGSGCGGPVPVLPETPAALFLPITAVAMFAGALAWARHRAGSENLAKRHHSSPS